MPRTPTIRILGVCHGPSGYSINPAILWTLDIDPGSAPLLADAGWAEFRAVYPRAETRPASADANPILDLTRLIALWAKEIQNSANGLIDDAGARVAATGQIVGWCGFHNAAIARLALGIALSCIAGAAGAPVDGASLASARERLHDEAAGRHIRNVGRPLAIAARALGIPYAPSLFYSTLWHYGWGRAGRFYLESTSNGDGIIGMRIARDKRITREFLRGLGFPVSEHTAVNSAEEAVAAAAGMRGPVVVKPLDRGKGLGVIVGIESETELRAAFAEARKWSEKPVLVERFVPGSDYRLLVMDGKLVAAARREPATVTGDGHSSVRQLIDALGKARAADAVFARYGYKIPLDAALDDELRRQGTHLDAVPASGVSLRLRSNANVSTGGTPTDVTGIVHRDVRAMAEAIARNMEVHALGIDYITPDITRSWHEVQGAIIEINLAPSLDVHVISGLSETEIGMAALGDGVGRIPVAVVIAPVAEQALLTERFRATPESSRTWRCGVLGNGEVTVGADRLLPFGRSSHHHVWQLLQNRDCDAALLCVTPNDVAVNGFPVDRCQLTILGRDLSHRDLMRTLADRCSERVIDAGNDAGWPGTEHIDALGSVLGPPR